MIQGYEKHNKLFEKYDLAVKIAFTILTIILLTGYFLACFRIGIIPGLSIIVISLLLFWACDKLLVNKRYRHKELRDKFKSLSEKTLDKKEFRKELGKIKNLEYKYFPPKIVVL